MARFEREAKLLASLNHQNIAGIYGRERAEGEQFIVMELVEGPTLADRIAEGAIPVPEALQIAKQIAEALDATITSPVAVTGVGMLLGPLARSAGASA